MSNASVSVSWWIVWEYPEDPRCREVIVTMPIRSPVRTVGALTVCAEVNRSIASGSRAGRHCLVRHVMTASRPPVPMFGPMDAYVQEFHLIALECLEVHPFPEPHATMAMQAPRTTPGHPDARVWENRSTVLEKWVVPHCPVHPVMTTIRERATMSGRATAHVSGHCSIVKVSRTDRPCLARPATTTTRTRSTTCGVRTAPALARL